MKKILKKTIAGITLLTVELALLWALLLISFSVFFYFTKLVFIDKRTGFDERAFAFTEANSSPALTRFMETITFFGSFEFLLGASLATAFYFLFIRKHKWYSMKVAVMAAGGTLLNQALKFFFERPRPTTELTNFSFPSGHTMIGLTFYGVLIYICWINIKNRALRYVVCGFFLVLVLIIAYSRVYLKFHYATDVVAGFTGGFLWLVAGIFVLKRIERFSRRKINPVVEEKSTAKA